MPILNSQGNAAHGIAGAGAYLNNAAIDAGGDACWLDNQTIAYQRFTPDGAIYLALYNIATKAIRRAVEDPGSLFYDKGENVLAAGGGTWAAWLAGFGLYTSRGEYLPSAGLLGVGDGGEMAYMPDQQTGYPVVVRETDGREWTLSEAGVLSADLLGAGRAVFADYENRIHAGGFPAPPIIVGGLGYRPRAACVGGVNWISYFSPTLGVITHPFDDPRGYVIAPPGVDCWQDIAALDGFPDALSVAWSPTQGEAPPITITAIDTRLTPRTDFTTQPPPLTLQPPGAVVDAWTLDALTEGKEFRFSDGANPDLGYAARVWVANGQLYGSIANAVGLSVTPEQGPLVACPEPTPPPPARYYLISAFGTQLVTGRDSYLTAAPVGEIFSIVPLAGGMVALQVRGFYVAAEGDGRCRADRSAVGAWETWTPVPQENGAMGFRSWAGLFLSCDDKRRVRADRPVLGPLETFTLG